MGDNTLADWFSRHTQQPDLFFRRLFRDAAKTTPKILKQYATELANKPVPDVLPHVNVFEDKMIKRFKELPPEQKETLVSIIVDLIKRKLCDKNNANNPVILEIMNFVARTFAASIPDSSASRDVTELINVIKKYAPNLANPSAYETAYLMSELDPQLEKTCPLGNAMCQNKLISIRRTYKKNIEASLQFGEKPFELLPVTTHLFHLQTYQELRDKIADFIALTPSEKREHAPLLQKQFEYQALYELTHVIAELYSLSQMLVNELGKKPVSNDNVGTILTKMEHLCSRTWQQTFADSMLPVEPKTLQDVQKCLVNPGHAPGAPAPRPPMMTGGGNSEQLQDWNLQLEIKDVQNKIFQLQSHVRSGFAELKRQLALASTSTSNNGSNISTFAHGQTLPRIQFLKQNVEAMVYKYLEIPSSDLIADRLPIKKDDKTLRNLRLNAKLTFGDIVTYKFSEERARIMYALKLLRLMGQVMALWLAQQAYMEEYNDAVYKHNVRPPKLSRMLYVFMSIDAAIQVVMLAILVLVSYVMVDKNDPRSQTFVINDEFIRDFLAEYFISTSMIAVMGMMVGAVVHRRKFFELEKTGKEGVDMFRQMMMIICVVVALIPIFLLF